MGSGIFESEFILGSASVWSLKACCDGVVVLSVSSFGASFSSLAGGGLVGSDSGLGSGEMEVAFDLSLISSTIFISPFSELLVGALAGESGVAGVDACWAGTVTGRDPSAASPLEAGECSFVSSSSSSLVDSVGMSTANNFFPVWAPTFASPRLERLVVDTDGRTMVLLRLTAVSGAEAFESLLVVVALTVRLNSSSSA